MSNYVPFNQNQTYQPYQATQYFLQPQGSIYMIASSNDIANVPVGAGLSAAICLREGIMYLKTIQNGSPMLLAYRLAPLENGEQIQDNANTNNIVCETDKKITAILQDYGKRIETLEKQAGIVNPTKTNGGNSVWPTI